MKSCLTLALVFVSAGLLNACRAIPHKESETTQATSRATIETNDSQAPLAAMSIPPNHCRIIATVIKIDPVVGETRGKDPCSKFPCRAIVRIDSLLGYGSAFPKPLAIGEQIPVMFAFTLSPTKETSAKINPPLPGLSVGSTFIADVRGSRALGEHEPSFSILIYEIRK